MEFMAGGSLYDIIKEYEKFKLKEEHIAYVLKEVMAQNSLPRHIMLMVSLLDLQRLGLHTRHETTSPRSESR
jgi:hypothetical protein